MTMSSLDVLLLYNEPLLPPDHPDRAAEAGVLETVAAVADALQAHRHRVRRIAAGDDTQELLATLANCAQPDVVFNLCEGLHGCGAGEAEVAGLVELLGWSMTGSSASCLALTQDKARTKWLLTGGGVPTPAFECLEREEAIVPARFERLLARGPVIVKPAREDASLGIGPRSVAKETSDLLGMIDDVRQLHGAVLVEQFVDGREFNAAIVALPVARSLPLAEIEFDPAITSTQRIVTYKAKWDLNSAECQRTPVRCPAQVDPVLAARIADVARDAFRLTGCRDYARVDLRTDTHGQVYVLEVNANPDLSPSAGLANALTADKMAYNQFIEQLVQHASRSSRGR